MAELQQPVETVEVELDYESYAVLHRVLGELDEEFDERVCVDDVVNALVQEHADSALTIDLVASYVGETEERE